MLYFLIFFVVAIWVLFDAKKRKEENIGWACIIFIGGPVTLPIYLARRNLLVGEMREGGKGWNITKYFALIWTSLMAVYAVMRLINSESAIGSAINLMAIGVIWIIPMIVALIIGVFLKTSIVEVGEIELPISKRSSKNSPLNDINIKK